MGTEPAAIGRYHLIRRIGEGGMGAVFEARDEKADLTVALKILLPEYARDRELIERLFREARALGRLRHPGIVEVFACGQEPDGTAYLAMEYLCGQTLAEWHAERPGPVPVPLALELAEQLAQALAAAHAKGVVHRDIKPANIMILHYGEGVPTHVKLLDFGLAKLLEDSNSHKSKTATDVIMGTPSYMSPEQCQGAGYVGAESDVYSLGVLMFELLSGRLPFDAEGSGRVLAMHMLKEAPRLREVAPEVPGGLADLVNTLLAKEAGQRPSMAALAGELARMRRDGNAAAASPLALTLLMPRQTPSPPSADSTSDRPRGQSFVVQKQRLRRGIGVVGFLVVGVVGMAGWRMIVHPMPSPLDSSTLKTGPASATASSPSDPADAAVPSDLGSVKTVDPTLYPPKPINVSGPKKPRRKPRVPDDPDLFEH